MSSALPVYEAEPNPQLASASEWHTKGNVVVSMDSYRPLVASPSIGTAGEPMNKIAMESASADLNAEARYVRISSATKAVSLFVLAICVFSFVVSIATEFSIINRFISVVVAFVSGGFYLIGLSLETNNVKSSGHSPSDGNMGNS